MADLRDGEKSENPEAAARFGPRTIIEARRDRSVQVLHEGPEQRAIWQRCASCSCQGHGKEHRRRCDDLADEKQDPSEHEDVQGEFRLSVRLADL